MRRESTTSRRTRFRSLILAALVALAAGSTLPVVEPVGAAFPGSNGRIVLASDRNVDNRNPEGDFEIFSMNPDGCGLKQRTKNDTADVELVWSPNGKRIAFTSYRDGEPRSTR